MHQDCNYKQFHLDIQKFHHHYILHHCLGHCQWLFHFHMIHRFHQDIDKSYHYQSLEDYSYKQFHLDIQQFHHRYKFHHCLGHCQWLLHLHMIHRFHQGINKSYHYQSLEDYSYMLFHLDIQQFPTYYKCHHHLHPYQLFHHWHTHHKYHRHKDKKSCHCQ